MMLRCTWTLGSAISSAEYSGNFYSSLRLVPTIEKLILVLFLIQFFFLKANLRLSLIFFSTKKNWAYSYEII